LNEPSGKLLTYLDHPNGWWRDNAQKELITRNDRKVVPALNQIALGNVGALKNKPGHLARMHALWTLEGLNAMDINLLFKAFKDENPQVRKTAVWISEPFIRKNNPLVIAKLAELQNDKSYDVLTQLVLSLSYTRSAKARAIVTYIKSKNLNNEMLVAVPKTLEVKENTKKYGSTLGNMPAEDRNLLVRGAGIYRQLCASCHAPDGKGLLVGGTKMAAPPLLGSARVKGDKQTLMRILLNGLTGPVDGAAYEAMPAFGAANNDQWVASVLSYVRSEFGKLRGSASIVDAKDVKEIRASSKRTKPWTLSEMEAPNVRR
jgi:mono/diheme cytochrome c family protein